MISCFFFLEFGAEGGTRWCTQFFDNPCPYWKLWFINDLVGLSGQIFFTARISNIWVFISILCFINAFLNSNGKIQDITKHSRYCIAFVYVHSDFSIEIIDISNAQHWFCETKIGVAAPKASVKGVGVQTKFIFPIQNDSFEAEVKSWNITVY